MTARPAPIPTLPEDLLTAEQVAVIYKCSADHIRNQAAAGNIPGAIRLGRLWRFSGPRLAEALHGQTP